MQPEWSNYSLMKAKQTNKQTYTHTHIYISIYQGSMFVYHVVDPLLDSPLCSQQLKVGMLCEGPLLFDSGNADGARTWTAAAKKIVVAFRGEEDRFLALHRQCMMINGREHDLTVAADVRLVIFTSLEEFESMARRAEASGAVGLVVVDNEDVFWWQLESQHGKEIIMHHLS